MPIFDTTTIAVALAIFFLVAALINTMVNRSRRRKIENRRAAQTGGGTEEAPIHLTTPFNETQSTYIPPPTPTPAAPAIPEKPKEDDYVWE